MNECMHACMNEWMHACTNEWMKVVEVNVIIIIIIIIIDLYSAISMAHGALQ